MQPTQSSPSYKLKNINSFYCQWHDMQECVQERYETKIEWKGKSVSPTKKEWAKMIWKGSPPKVYN